MKYTLFSSLIKCNTFKDRNLLSLLMPWQGVGGEVVFSENFRWRVDPSHLKWSLVSAKNPVNNNGDLSDDVFTRTIASPMLREPPTTISLHLRPIPWDEHPPWHC